MEKQGAYVATSTVNPNQPDVLFELIYLEEEFAGDDVSFLECPQDSVVLEAEIEGLLYSWSTAETSSSIQVDASFDVSYNLTISTIFGDSDSKVYNVNRVVEPELVSTVTDATSCTQEGQLTLTLQDFDLSDLPVMAAIYRGGDLYQNVLFSDTIVSLSLPAGNYNEVKIGSYNGCNFTYAGFDIGHFIGISEEVDMPAVTVCDGDSYTLKALGGYAQYLWDSGSETRTTVVTPLSSQTYSVEVYDSNGCGLKLNYPVAVVDYPVAVFDFVDNAPFTGGRLSLGVTNAQSYMFPMDVYATNNGSDILISTLQEANSNIIVQDNYYENLRLVSAPGCQTYLGSFGSTNSGIGSVVMDPTYVCEGVSFTLTAPSGYASYAWSDGSDGENYSSVALSNEEVTLFAMDFNGNVSDFTYPVEISAVAEAQFAVNNRESIILGSIDIEILSATQAMYPLEVYVSDLVTGQEVYLGPMFTSTYNFQLGDASYSNLRIQNSLGCNTYLGDFDIVYDDGSRNKRIAGKVWLDISSETGILENVESGLEGVVVRAYTVKGKMQGEAVTDSEGAYTIEVDSDAVYLEFDPEYNLSTTAPNVGSNEDIDSDVDGSNGPRTTDMINPNETSSVNAGFVYGVLSISWNDISVSSSDDQHKISWNVNGDQNISHFELERSIGGINDFEMVGKVSPQESFIASNAYSHIDNDVSELNTYYYRVKQVDVDGSFSHSKIVSINVDELSLNNSDLSVTLFPMPATTHINVEIDSAVKNNEVQAAIYSISGQLVLSKTYSDLDDGNIINIDISNLETNTYVMNVTIDNQVISKQIIIE